MANYTTLSGLFTGIADAIRSKTGDTAKIIAADFPTKIANISTGFPNGTEWTYIDRTAYVICPNKFYNANGIWVAASSNGLYYSTNGMTWTQSNGNVTGSFDTVYNANGIWVTGGSTAGLYYSVSWQPT